MTKKFFLLAAVFIVLFTAIDANAQGSRWGIVAGVNLNEIHFKQQDIFPVDRGIGATAGIMGELMMPGVGFGFEAQLLYTMRSSRLHFGDREAWRSQGLGNEQVLLHYIDIPISLKFKYRNLNGIETIVAPMVYAGPVFTFLAGHSKVNDVLDCSTFNLGLRAGVGAELFQRVQVSASYTFSIGNALNTRVLDNHDAKNRCWTISAVYLF